MIIPSLDLIKGNVVRLYQGNYNLQRNYNIKPILQLFKYAKQGAKIIHLVDLDGAKNPKFRQVNLLKYLIYNINPVKVQVGGGVRCIDDIKFLLKAGASRIVIGSAAIKKPYEVIKWFRIFGPDILVLSLDIYIKNKNFYTVAINGWQKDSNITLKEVIEKYYKVGLKHVLCTDISRDGTLSGINFSFYFNLCSTWPNIFFQSSGGVSSLNNIPYLIICGVKSIVLGRSLLENKFSLLEVSQCWQNV